jgi:hypothetical protein
MLRTLTLLSVFAASSALYAQGPEFGIKAGLTYSTLYSDEVDDKNARLGFNGGVFGRTDPEQSLGFQAELLYNMRGAEFASEFLFIEQEWDFRMSYLDLPLMLGIRLGEVIEIHAGGYISYLLSAELETSGDLGADTDPVDRENFRSMDYGVLAGLSVNAGPVQIGGRYNLGLAQIADSDEAEFVLGDAKHAFAQLYVGLGLSK